MTWWGYMLLVYLLFAGFCWLLCRCAADADRRIRRLGRGPHPGGARGLGKAARQEPSRPMHRVL